MAKELSPEKKAKILIDSESNTDKVVAGRWNIGVRTLERMRSQLETDDALRACYEKEKQEAAERQHKIATQWVGDACRLIKTSASELETVIKRKNPKDANWITAVAGAAKSFAEMQISHAVLMDEPSDN